MAVRIAGVTIPNDKRVEIALTYILGIGKSKSNEIFVSFFNRIACNIILLV